jgi:hypothetical protein
MNNNIKQIVKETRNEKNITPDRLRNVDFFISTKGGMTRAVARKLLLRKDVKSASRSLSPNNIDLRLETSLKGNEEILRLLGTIKGMEGVRDAVWNEVIDIIGSKKWPPDPEVNSSY